MTMTLWSDEVVERVAVRSSEQICDHLQNTFDMDEIGDAAWEDFSVKVCDIVIDELRAALAAMPQPAVTEALERIANHESSVPDSHMECGNCHDAFLDDYVSVKRIASEALAMSAKSEAPIEDKTR